MRKAQRHIDFAAFIQNHEEEIFGKKRDLTFLLGLFAFSISQFAVQIKTDVNRYAAAFYALFEEGEEQ